MSSSSHHPISLPFSFPVDSLLLSSVEQPNLSESWNSIYTLVNKALLDHSSLVGHALFPVQDHPASSFILQLAFSCYPPALLHLVNISPTRLNLDQHHIHATALLISLTNNLRVTSLKFQPILIPPPHAHLQSALGSSLRPQRPFLRTEAVNVLHQPTPSPDPHQSWASRVLVALCGPPITMTLKLVHASFSSQDKLGFFREQFRRSLISFSHRTIERAENKTNQYRIMEKEFLRAIKSDIERLLHSPDWPGFEATYLPSPNSPSPRKVGLRRFESPRPQTTPDSPIEGFGLGVISPSPPDCRTQTDPGVQVNTEDVGPAIADPPFDSTPFRSEQSGTVYFRQLLNASVVCLIFQLYWTSVNLISWLELTITQLAYRSVLWLGTTRHERRNSGTITVGASSRSKAEPNKLLKISTSLASKEKPVGQLSSIMKMPMAESLNVCRTPARMARNVSWDTGSVVDEESAHGVERKLYHVHSKDSKILPKSPKPTATQRFLDTRRVSKPKIEKMAFMSPSREANLPPSEMSDQEGTVDQDECSVADTGSLPPSPDQTLTQKPAVLRDIMKQSTGAAARDLLKVTPDFLPVSPPMESDDDMVSCSTAGSLHADDGSGPQMLVRTKGFGMAFDLSIKLCSFNPFFFRTIRLVVIL